MPRTERDREKERRRKHRAKLKKLEERYRKATTQVDKTAIAAKVRRFSPMVDLEKRASSATAASTPAKSSASSKKK